MGIAWKLAAGVPALLFICVGLAWWIVPGFISAQLGMPLLNGVGLSTQIGDLASFFLTLGSCILIGLASGNRVWLYPSIMLLSFATVGRILAWLIHGATLTVEMIAVEWITIAVLILVSREMAKQKA